MEFIQELKQQAYDNLDIEGHVVDIHGWMSHSFGEVVRRSVAHLDRASELVVV